MARDDDSHQGIDRTRRRMLMRLGLAGTLAYAAPALTGLSMAHASGASSGPSRSSAPSAPSGPTGPSAPGRPTSEQSSQSEGSSGRGATYRQGELVVLLPAGQQVQRLVDAGYSVISQSTTSSSGGTLLRLGTRPGADLDTARAEIAALSPGTTTEPNHLYRTAEFLCGPDGCAAQEMIGWSGWPSALAPRIGMIDTGINPDHEALVGQRITVIRPDLGGLPGAGRQHGTAIAVLLVGRLDSRTPGLLPLAELIAIEAFHSDGVGDAADAYHLAQAIDRLVAEGVSVINMSFSGPANAVLGEMIAKAHAAGVGLVAAAGNEGPMAGPNFPAAWPQVLAVTAVDRNRQSYRQANRGDHIGLAAPGVQLWTAASVSGGRFRSGTSFAAPFVTAALAVQRMRQPEASLPQAMAALQSCAADLGAPGPDPVFGHGMVQSPELCEADFFSETLE